MGVLESLDISAIPAIVAALNTMGSMWLPSSMKGTIASAGFSTETLHNSLVNSLLSQINTFFRCPKLTLDLDDGTKLEVLLYCTGYKEKWESDISEQLFVNVEGSQQYATDNFANKPRQWELTGYIMSLTTFQAIAEKEDKFGATAWQSFTSAVDTLATSIKEPSCLYMPSLLKQKKYISDMQAYRRPITFRDKHQEEYLVGIASVDWDFDATVQNAYPFTMTLRETPVLIVATDELSAADLANYQNTTKRYSTSMGGNKTDFLVEMENGKASEVMSNRVGNYNSWLGTK